MIPYFIITLTVMLLFAGALVLGRMFNKRGYVRNCSGGAGNCQGDSDNCSCSR